MITCIIAEGDSLTYAAIGYFYGYGGVGGQVSLSSKYRAQHSFRFFPVAGMICANKSIGGSRVQTNGPSGDYPGDLTFRASTVDALLAPLERPLFSTGLLDERPPRNYILSLMIGTNPDTSNFTTHASNVSSYCSARLAAGYDRIILGTLLPRGDGILADFETYRNGYNAIIRDPAWQSANNIAGIFDFGAEPTVGVAAATANSTYYSDTVHPTSAAYTLLQPIYNATVDEVVASV